MELHTLYKHISNRDVAIYPIDIEEGDTTLTVKCYWVNVHYNELTGTDPFVIASKKGPICSTIVIEKEALVNWKPYGVQENKRSL